jgi:hypothetical protein
MSEGLTKGEAVPRNVLPELRVGHLLRISGYLEYAFHAMWAERRPQVVMGMAEASVRDTGPGGPEGPDEELLERLRNLIAEAREYHAADDFPAAMARMRVAEDLVALRIIELLRG